MSSSHDPPRTGDTLVGAFDAVLAALEGALAFCEWPELEVQLRAHLMDPGLPAITVLPLASCAAAGGQPELAAPVASASLLVIVCTRWLDDLADRDRDGALWQRVGPARAMTLSAGALTLAWHTLVSNPGLPRDLLERLGRTTLRIGAGQDLDLSLQKPSVEQAWEIMRGKTAAGYAFLCGGGARVAASDTAPFDAFGEHLGVAIQLLDDLDAVARPVGEGDLKTGKQCNLVLVHGLSGPHSEVIGERLRSGDVAAARELLLESGSARAVLGAALHERDLALAGLESAAEVPGDLARAGRERLIDFACGIFSDLPPELGLPGDLRGPLGG